VFPPLLLQISDDRLSTKAHQEGGSAEIHPDGLVASWVYDEKFLTTMRLLFRTLSFTMEEDNDLERLTQEQEEWHTMMIGFKFPRDLKNSVTTFQVAVRRPSTTNPIDGPTRPLIGTPLVTTRSFGLALSEIQTMKIEESTWASVAIEKRSISPASTQQSMGPQRQNAAHLHQVALHLSLAFSTVRLPNLWDRSGLSLLNRCTLSDRQEMHHYIRSNIFRSNQYGTTSLNGAS
jgi:hypothetical protein